MLTFTIMIALCRSILWLGTSVISARKFTWALQVSTVVQPYSCLPSQDVGCRPIHAPSGHTVPLVLHLSLVPLSPPPFPIPGGNRLLLLFEIDSQYAQTLASKVYPNTR